MKFQFAFKALAILAISAGLLIALASIETKVFERDQYRQQAKSAIANGWSGQQLVASPVLSLTLVKKYTEEVFDKHLERYVSKTRTRTWEEWVLPDQLKIHSQVAMQQRSLGIYEIPVFETNLLLEGTFSKAINLGEGVTIRQAKILASFTDMRGISTTPEIWWNASPLNVEPGDKGRLLGNHIFVDITSGNPLAPGKFRMRTQLRGMDSIHFVPLAKQITTTVEADWPHPYFEGKYLPQHRQVSATGFNAVWNLTEFATSINQLVTQCEQSHADCANRLTNNSFGVGLHNPVDVYQKSTRSIKYGFLFIILTFATFCLIEVIKRRSIHPIQYALVGCSLAIFYLLLVSLSEHIDFAMAYLLAAVACISLLGIYLRYVFKSARLAMQMSAGFSVLYAMLYITLKSEDYALLMGAGLTFISLGMIMLATRNIDWYQLSGVPATGADPKPDAEKNSSLASQS